MSNITVELWMDIGCPWSRISLAELDRVRSEFDRPVAMSFHSLRIDPDSPADYGRTTIENLCDHLAIEPAQAEEMLRVVVDAGARVGLNFDFRRARGGNSFDAHRLIRLAAVTGCHLNLVLALFAAHFEEGLLISDRSVLSSIARGVGLPEEQVRELLEGDAYAHEVLNDESTAQKLGIDRSPHIVVNNDVVLVGVQYADDWRNIFQRIIDSAE